jgi:tetratricopeptide (TPR) repeat protein
MWQQLKRQLRREWECRLIRRFHAHLAAARFDAAFEIAEALLDFGPSAEGYEFLTCPIDPSQTGLRDGELRELLERLEAVGTSRYPAWREHLRASLLQRLPRTGKVDFGAAMIDVPERYGWMRFLHGHFVRDHKLAYREAIADFDATFRAAPGFWKAAACKAECVLCLGEEQEAFRTFDECIARVRRLGLSGDLAAAIAWRGELRLWVGHYQAALRDFEEAGTGGWLATLGPKGSTLLALGWRGAAHLMLGQTEQALIDLDRVLRRTPDDAEALAWRGEAHARLARWDAALADFDRSARKTAQPVWPLVGRALVKARMGDADGLLSDYDLLPARVTTFFERTMSIDVARDAERATAVLESMRAAARGIRRSDLYMYPLWMTSTSSTSPSPFERLGFGTHDGS